MTTDASRPEVLRYTAFSSDPDGGNPAGVVLDATGLDDGDMLAIAADWSPRTPCSPCARARTWAAPASSR